MTNAHEHEKKHEKKSAPGKKSELGHEPGNEGEGSYTGAKHYDERTEEFIRSGRVEKSAKEAERAVEGKERDELERAEKIGKKHARH